MQIYANVQSESRALAPTVLKYKSSFNCMSCDNFLLSLSSYHSLSISLQCLLFVSLLFLFLGTIPTKVTYLSNLVKNNFLPHMVCFFSVFDVVDYLLFLTWFAFGLYKHILCGFLCFYSPTFSVFFRGSSFHCLPFRCWCFKVFTWSCSWSCSCSRSCCISPILTGRFIYTHGFSHLLHTDCRLS